MPRPLPGDVRVVPPPHIHYKTSKRGYVELITQMYFSGEELNKVDRLLMRKAEHERPKMVARADPERKDHFNFDLVVETA